MDVDVLVVPVAVRPGTVDSGAQLMALRPSGGWIRQGANADLVADPTSLALTVPALAPLLGTRMAAIEPVTFIPGRQLTLIYTLSLPMALAAPEVPVLTDWVPLLKPAHATAAEARLVGREAVADYDHAFRVADYWRQRLEETAALWGFLSEHFTARQARDVYNAVWGYEQDPDGFSSWSGIGAKHDGVFSAQIERSQFGEMELRDELGEALIQIDDAATESDSTRALVAGQLAQLSAMTGTGLAVATVSAMLPATALPMLGAAVGTVGFLRRTRGKQPVWFRRTDPDPDPRRLLDRSYAPRPAWAVPGTGGDPGSTDTPS